MKDKKPRDEARCAEARETLIKALDLMDSYFLKDKDFVVGSEISIADLAFLGEVTQYWVANCDIYKGRPNIERWMERCQKVLAPHFEPIFDKVYEIRKAGTYHYPIDVGQTK